MNKEKKTMIIGALLTILALLIAGLIFFFIYNNEQSSQDSNNNTNLNETNNNENNNLNSNNNTNNFNSNSDINNTDNSNNNTPVNSDTKNTVTIYLFRGNGCPHCEHAMEFLESIADDYPYLEIISYEVWYNKENQELLEAVSNELGIEFSTSVPFIIIGNEYQKRGFSDGMEDGIIKEIESSYQNENYEDIVKKVLENNNLNVTAEIINKFPPAKLVVFLFRLKGFITGLY